MAVLALGLSACGAHTQKPLQEGPVSLKRGDGKIKVAVLPMDVQLSEISAAGVKQPRADWTAAAREHLRSVLETELAEKGVALAFVDADRLMPALAADLDQMAKVQSLIAGAVIRHKHVPGRALPTKERLWDWSLGPAVRQLKDTTGADYGLFLEIHDSYTSAERVAVILIGLAFNARVEGGQQVASASLVDLDSGALLWHGLLARPSGDLRNLPDAASTAKLLLASFPSN